MELLVLPLLLLAGLLTTLDGADEDAAGGEAARDIDSLFALESATDYGLDGEDTLVADENATISGGEGDDHLNPGHEAEAEADGGTGDEAAYGGEGSDTLTATDDALNNGGAGAGGVNDTLTGTGNETVSGGEGNDLIHISDRAIAYGGAGDDSFLVSDVFTTGNANLYGGDGADLFVANLAALDGATGCPTLRISDYTPGLDRLGILLGDRDIETLQVRICEQDSPDPEEFNGTEINIGLVGDGTNSTFANFWLPGVTNFDMSDLVFYRNEIGDAVNVEPVPDGENDVLVRDADGAARGGDGDDLFTLSDTATGNGGVGNDTLIAMDGATADGAAGDDLLLGAGDATLMGGDGADSLNGGAWLDGGAGNDVLANGMMQYGGEGDDEISAGTEVYGGSGDDTVSTFSGNTVDLGAGDDLALVTTSSAPGQFGIGTVTLGDGADRLVMDPTYHDNIVLDVTDFDAVGDELGVIGLAPDLQAVSVSRSYDTASNTTTVRIDTGVDDIGAVMLVDLVGVNALTGPLTIRLYADEAAARAGTSYRTL